jgi:hypothetical protein
MARSDQPVAGGAPGTQIASIWIALTAIAVRSVHASQQTFSKWAILTTASDAAKFILGGNRQAP